MRKAVSTSLSKAMSKMPVSAFPMEKLDDECWGAGLCPCACPPPSTGMNGTWVRACPALREHWLNE